MFCPALPEEARSDPDVFPVTDASLRVPGAAAGSFLFFHIVFFAREERWSGKERPLKTSLTTVSFGGEEERKEKSRTPERKVIRMSAQAVMSFEVRSCELVTICTGIRAKTLGELREGIRAVPEGCLHYHFWGRLMRPQIGESEFDNDFAGWVAGSLHDVTLAERMSAVNPADFADLEELRGALLDLLDDRLDTEESTAWSRGDAPFFFTRAQLLVFPPHRTIARPEEFPEALRGMDRSSLFYHFIDAARRTSLHCDDVTAWLEGFGSSTEDLRKRLRRVDPYLLSLEELREYLLLAFEEGVGKGEAPGSAPGGGASGTSGGAAGHVRGTSPEGAEGVVSRGGDGA